MKMFSTQGLFRDKLQQIPGEKVYDRANVSGLQVKDFETMINRAQTIDSNHVVEMVLSFVAGVFCIQLVAGVGRLVRPNRDPADTSSQGSFGQEQLIEGPSA
jgi:hypothetical protein